jgi:hypothetical protein
MRAAGDAGVGSVAVHVQERLAVVSRQMDTAVPGLVSEAGVVWKPTNLRAKPFRFQITRAIAPVRARNYLETWV